MGHCTTSHIKTQTPANQNYEANLSKNIYIDSSKFQELNFIPQNTCNETSLSTSTHLNLNLKAKNPDLEKDVLGTAHV